MMRTLAEKGALIIADNGKRNRVSNKVKSRIKKGKDRSCSVAAPTTNTKDTAKSVTQRRQRLWRNIKSKNRRKPRKENELRPRRNQAKTGKARERKPNSDNESRVDLMLKRIRRHLEE